MSTGQTITSVMAELLAELPTSVSRELRVSEPVSRFVRETYAKAVDVSHAERMFAVPIVVDGDLTAGQRQIRENGEVTASGDIAPAPDGMQVEYSPIAGWYAFNPDLLKMPVTADWRVW